jgi:acyl-CoA thioesterase I
MRLAWIAAAALSLAAAAAHAQTAIPPIVAFGSSNVSGFGVAPDQTFVADLQAMLSAKGYPVSVVNQGVYGDTTAQMLAREDAAVPPGTRIVILDEAGGLFNDWVKRIPQPQGQADMATITSKLTSRGITVIPMNGAKLSPEDHQADGRHLNAAGHRAIATQLLPQVQAALGPAS